MGFDNECVINMQSLAREFFCPFCRSLVYPGEAVQAPCMHLFCRPCLGYIASHTQVCPWDGHFVTVENSKPLVESNEELAVTVGKIFVRCLYHKSGCAWQGPLSECLNHCSGCTVGNSLISCNLCGSQLAHHLAQEHRQNCLNLQPQAMSSQAQQRRDMFGHQQQGQQHYGHLPPQLQMNHQPPVPSQPPTIFLGPQVMQQWSPQRAPPFLGPPFPLRPQFPASLPALPLEQPQLQMLPLYPYTPPLPPPLPLPQLSYQVQAQEPQHFPGHPPPPPPLVPPLALSQCAPQPHLLTQPPLQVPHPFHPTVPQHPPHPNFLHPSVAVPPSYEHHSQGVAYDPNRQPSHWQMPLPSVNPQPIPPLQLQPDPIPEVPLHMQPLGLAPPPILQADRNQSQFPVTDDRFQPPQLLVGDDRFQPPQLLVGIADNTSVQQNPVHPFGPPSVPYHLQQPVYPQLQPVASSNSQNCSQNLLGGPNLSQVPSFKCSESKTECPVYSIKVKGEASESQSVALSKTSAQFVSEDGPPGFENVTQRPRSDDIHAGSESSVPRKINCSITQPSASLMDSSRQGHPQFQEPGSRGRSPLSNDETRTDGLGPFHYSGDMDVGSNRQRRTRDANHATAEGSHSGPQVQDHQNAAADVAPDGKPENAKRRKTG